MGIARTGAKTDVMHDVQTGCTEDAWMGATTDALHKLQTGCTENAQMGAMTDVMHDVQMDCMDDAQTGAPKGITYDVLMVGDFTGFWSGNLPQVPPIITGELRWVCSRW